MCHCVLIYFCKAVLLRKLLWPTSQIHRHLQYLAEVESLRTSLASRTHFKVLGLGAKREVLGLKAPALGSRTALFFEQLKFCWKMLETSRKICEDLFCFLLLQHRRSQRVGASPSSPIQIPPMAKM